PRGSISRAGSVPSPGRSSDGEGRSEIILSAAEKEQTMRDRGLQVQLVAVLCTAALAALLPPAARAEEGGLRCHDVTFAVALSPGDAQVHQVFGVLCAQGSVHGKTIQIALHGSSYSHVYWDWPQEPEIYSYVRRATAAGYAVLDLDRIGIGRSDHPPADQVD